MRTTSALHKTGHFLSKADCVGVGAFSPLPNNVEHCSSIKGTESGTILGSESFIGDTQPAKLE